MTNLQIDFPLIQLRGKPSDVAPDLASVTNDYFSQRPEGGLVIHFLSEFISEDRRARQAAVWGRFYREQLRAYPVFLCWGAPLSETLDPFFQRLRNDRFIRNACTWCDSFFARPFRELSQGLGRRGSANPATPSSAFEDFPVPVFDDSIDDLHRRGTIWEAISLNKGDVTDSLESVEGIDETLIPLETWLHNPAPETCPYPFAPELLGQLRPGKIGPRGGFLEHLVMFFGDQLFHVGLKIGERWREGRDHGFRATVVEELLRAFYFSNLGVHRRQEVKGGFRFTFDSGELGDSFVGRLVDAGLDSLLVVGQGLGCEGSRHFLRRIWNKRTRSVRARLALLAPSVDFSPLTETMEQGFSEGNLTGVKVYGLDDARERSDAMIPVLYQLSSLYFTCGLLETEPDKPLVGMHRFHSGKPPFDSNRAPEIASFAKVLVDRPARVVWSPSTDSETRQHTDWENDQPTKDSLAQFHNGGRACGGL